MLPLRALGGTVVLLLMTGTAACQQDGSGVPGDASVDDFCAAYFSLFAGRMSDVDPGASEREQGAAMADAVRAWAAQLKDVGTPDDRSEVAREGLEVILRAADGLPAEGTLNLADLDDDFTDGETAATQAFEEYATRSCPSPFENPPGN